METLKRKFKQGITKANHLRDYILTPNERDIIKEYIATGKKLDGFKLILCRARKHNNKEVISDEELLKQFLEKAGEKP